MDRSIARMALALTIGVISGAIAFFLGLPLPWMLGPMIGTTIAAIAHAPVHAPVKLRPVVIPVIGVMLGSAFSPDILDAVGQWVVTLAMLPPFIVTAAALSYVFYRRVGKYDPITAFYCAMPGGLNEMLILGTAAGGDERRIALAHALRVLVVVTFVVGFFGLFLDVATSRSGKAWTGFSSLAPLDIVLLSLSAVVGGWLGNLLRLPAHNLLGPMVLSAIAHMTGWVTLPPPSLLVIIAQIVIGTIIGCRFVGTSPATIARDMLIGGGASVCMIAVALGFAWGVTVLTDVELTQAFLAFSPGGLTEMSLLALAMGKDVAYIAVSHTARIVLVVVMAPLMFRVGKLRTKDKPPGPGAA